MADTLLITGGCGFIGSNFLHMLSGMGYDGRVINVDCMTYAANSYNMKGLSLNIKTEVEHIEDPEAMDRVFSKHRPERVVNFAAESHVDRSITGAGVFVQSNVMGTLVLLDMAKKHGIKRFLQVSTDEVYGDLIENERPSVETDHLKPSSPYSVSKASADLMVLAYKRTHGMDVVVTRCSNNYGPRQYPEKLIPLAIQKLKEGKKVPVYGDGRNVRDWIYVDDHCRGIWDALTKGVSGQIYNFGGANQVRNIELVRMLLGLMGKGEDSIEFVKDRPGHDMRYDMDFSKASRELGWYPTLPFEAGLKKTVEWYIKES
jgi:dTDP-glucose 4,6-dehydratase